MAYARHIDCENRRRSAIAAIKAILPLDLYLPHKRRFLSLGLWKLTEAEGTSKYLTRFRSACSIKEPVKNLRHDHVFCRNAMIRALLQRPDNADEILAVAVGCTVTKHEHDELTNITRQFPELDGWERYKRARIEVIDMETCEAVKL